jgi:ribosomal protein L16/L10AE
MAKVYPHKRCTEPRFTGDRGHGIGRREFWLVIVTTGCIVDHKKFHADEEDKARAFVSNLVNQKGYALV